MTETDKPLRNPEAYLRERQPRRKLQGHVDRVRLLLENGFSSYMIWRYLNDEQVVPVSKNTVLRFVRDLQQADVKGSRRHPQVTEGSPTLTAALEERRHIAAESPKVTPTIDSSIGSPAQPCLGHPTSVPPPTAEAQVDQIISQANNEPGDSTFAEKDDRSHSRISAARSSAIAPAPDVMRRFDPNDRGFIQEELNLRWGGRPRTKPGPN